MKKATLKAMKEKLEAERERVIGELDKLGTRDLKAVDKKEWDARYVDVGSDTADNAYEVDQFATNKSIELALEKSLRDVEKALKRIEDGSYGICKYCDQEISEPRLNARPDSSSCIACKKTFTKEA